MWSISADDARPGDLDTQIGGLLASVSGDLAVWKHLTDVYSVDLFCGLFIVGGNQGLTLSSSTLEALGARGIKLDLDLYARARGRNIE